jgi:hypothetical protein
MPEVLRQNAPQVAHDSLRSAGLSLDEIALVRKLMWPHLRDASLAGWKSDPRRQRARQRLHLYKHMGISPSEPSSGRGGATAACPQTDYCSNRNSPAYSPRTRLF